MNQSVNAPASEGQLYLAILKQFKYLRKTDQQFADKYKEDDFEKWLIEKKGQLHE